MGKLTLLLLLLGLIVGMPQAESTDLSNGVFIVHVPPTLQFTVGNAPWLCEKYQTCCEIQSCQEQVTRIDTKDGVIWFILAAWNEEKEWCGTGIGLGDYDADIFGFADHGPCFDTVGLHWPNPGWPGPNKGVLVASTEGPWKGNFVPIYYFTGYAYAEGVIPLAKEPATKTAGTAGCSKGEKPRTYHAEALGALGLFTDGIAVCPPDEPVGESPTDSEQDTTNVKAEEDTIAGQAGQGATEVQAEQNSSDEEASGSTSEEPE